MRMFAAPIERHARSSTQTGELAFTPSGLRYRVPGAVTPVRDQLDATSRRYVAARR